jgi:hypothetical protein
VGRKFRDGWAVTTPGFRAWEVIDRAFGDLSALLEDQLIAQVDALPLLRAVSPSTIAAEGKETSDFSPVADMLRGQFVESPDTMRMIRIGNVLDRLGGDGKELLQAMADQSNSESGPFGLQLQALASIDTGSFGGDLDDLIYGGDGHEWIEGHQGNDTLSGNGGQDILIGGVGNDSLVGGLGHDVYVVSSGDGADIIHDNDSTPGNVDEVRFLDVSSTDVQGVQRVGNSLLMSYGSSDQVTVQYYFTSAAYRIEQFRFDDGVMWGLAELEQRMLSGAAFG